MGASSTVERGLEGGPVPPVLLRLPWSYLLCSAPEGSRSAGGFVKSHNRGTSLLMNLCGPPLSPKLTVGP